MTRQVIRKKERERERDLLKDLFRYLLKYLPLLVTLKQAKLPLITLKITVSSFHVFILYHLKNIPPLPQSTQDKCILVGTHYDSHSEKHPYSGMLFNVCSSPIEVNGFLKKNGPKQILKVKHILGYFSELELMYVCASCNLQCVSCVQGVFHVCKGCPMFSCSCISGLLTWTLAIDCVIAMMMVSHMKPVLKCRCKKHTYMKM